jgi:hypothetical protein
MSAQISVRARDHQHAVSPRLAHIRPRGILAEDFALVTVNAGGVDSNLFRFRSAEAGAILARRRAKTGAEDDSHPVRRSEAAIEGDGHKSERLLVVEFD